MRLLGPHLTGDNHRALLAAASGKSRRDVEELIARHFPQPDVPCSVRKLPAAKAIETHPRPVRPLAPERYEIRFTASAATCEKLRRAQDLLRHRIPNGDVAEIVDRALTALLEDLARRKFAATHRPRASRARAGHWRYVPAAVKRTVGLRDGDRCAFVGRNGRRCAERGFLEFHHVNPHEEPTVDNIQLRCRAHNAYEADLYYGPRDPAGDSFRNESPATPNALSVSTSPTASGSP